jgi:hypothetical protein
MAKFGTVLSEQLAEVGRQLEELKAQEEAIRAEAAERLRGLSEERTRLEARARHIQALLALEGQAEGVALQQHEEDRRRSDAWLDTESISLADAAHRVLQEVGRELHYKELATELQLRGISIPGKDPPINLVAHIHEDPRLIRPKRGVYALKEWYPRLKASVGTRKRRRSTANKPRRKTVARRMGR